MAEIIEMPKLSDTMTTGTLVKWLKQEGDSVSSGEMLAEVETDKATMELESFEDGVVLKHFVSEGEQVEVGAPVCAIGEKGEKVEAPGGGASKPTVAKKEQAKEEKSAPGASSSGSSADKSGDGKKRIKASPLARKLAKDEGVDLSKVTGSGPRGRIVRADVIKAAPGGGSSVREISSAPAQAFQPAASARDEDIPVSNMRGVIARRLLESKTTIPHFYLETEVDMEPLLALRVSLNDKLGQLPPEKGGAKLTVNDLILKATAVALRRVPAANASWLGDRIRQHGAVHVAFAVAVEEGLVTPVVTNTDQKSIRQISAEARSLIEKAKSKKLRPEEMSGSTFTVTNLGMYGITAFYGIINPPNAAILSVGATVRKPVVAADGSIRAGQRMTLGLSGDHRVVDGAVGAEFLAALREIVETPALILV